MTTKDWPLCVLPQPTHHTHSQGLCKEDVSSRAYNPLMNTSSLKKERKNETEEAISISCLLSMASIVCQNGLASGSSMNLEFLRNFEYLGLVG